MYQDGDICYSSPDVELEGKTALVTEEPGAWEPKRYAP
jgi:hypothetical protein